MRPFTLLAASLFVFIAGVAVATAQETPAQILTADRHALNIAVDDAVAAREALALAFQAGNPQDIQAAEANLQTALANVAAARAQLQSDADTIKAEGIKVLEPDQQAIAVIRADIAADIAALANGDASTIAQLTSDLNALTAAKQKEHADFVAFFGASNSPPGGTTGAIIATDETVVRQDAETVAALERAIAEATSPTVIAQLQTLLATAQSQLSTDKATLAAERAAAYADAKAILNADRQAVEIAEAAVRTAEKQLAKDIAAGNTAAIPGDQAALQTVQDAYQQARYTLAEERIDALDAKHPWRNDGDDHGWAGPKATIAGAPRSDSRHGK